MALIKKVTFTDGTTANFKDNTVRTWSTEATSETALHIYGLSVSDVSSSSVTASDSNPLVSFEPYSQSYGETYTEGTFKVYNNLLATNNASITFSASGTQGSTHIYLLVDLPSGLVEQGYEGTGLIDLVGLYPVGMNFYLTSADYPDRWFAGYTQDTGESGSTTETDTATFYRLQEINGVSNPVDKGNYNFDSVTLSNGTGTTSSGSSNASPTGSGSFNYSAHTHGITYDSTATFSGEQTVAEHSHTVNNTTASNFDGSVSGTYSTLDTTKASSEQDAVTIDGSNFSYDKPKQADSAGAATISGSKFSYLKTDSTTGEAGAYTVKDCFKYIGNTVTVSGTILNIAYTTNTVSGQQYQAAHSHTVSYATATLSGTQDVAAHTHSVSTSSVKMSGSQVENDHTHTIYDTTSNFTFNLTDLYYYIPTIAKNADVTIQGKTFSYLKSNSATEKNTAYSCTLTGTFDFQHTHSFSLNFGTHKHTIDIKDSNMTTA